MVLNTVTHLNDYLFDLVVADEAGRRQTIRTTGLHKFWSETRKDWDSAETLTPNELLQGVDGRLTVASLTRFPGRYRVYNLTVEHEHVFRVSHLGVLVHNNGCRPVFDHRVGRWRDPATGRFVKEPRPDLGRPGTQRNPDGTLKDPADQLDELRRARDRGAFIESDGKSEQGFKQFLKDLKDGRIDPE